jgi:hypothetical protein
MKMALSASSTEKLKRAARRFRVFQITGAGIAIIAVPFQFNAAANGVKQGDRPLSTEDYTVNDFMFGVTQL